MFALTLVALLACAPKLVPSALHVENRETTAAQAEAVLAPLRPLVDSCLEQQGVASGEGPWVRLDLGADGVVERVRARGPAARCARSRLRGARTLLLGEPATLQASMTWDPTRATAAAQPITASQALDLYGSLKPLVAQGRPGALWQHLDSVDDHQLAVLLPGVVAALDVAAGGSMDRCEELAVGATMAAELHQAQYQRWASCRPCFGPFPDDFLSMPDAERTAWAIERCDAAGPDPVFGGALTELRPRMSWLDYAASRVIVGRYLARLDTQGEAGADGRRALEARLPRLAWALAHQRDARVVGDMRQFLHLYRANRPTVPGAPQINMAMELTPFQWTRGWGSPGAKELHYAAGKTTHRPWDARVLEHFVAALEAHGCDTSGAELIAVPPRSAAEVDLAGRCGFEPLPMVGTRAAVMDWPDAWMLQATFGELHTWCMEHDQPELWRRWEPELPRHMRAAVRPDER